ncbi:type II toxin-antitoxin system VapB family antitoxin [Paracoccus sp. p3-h83]|uniref:type II toxin-antitoxin system VapB family antitoxin n=1 Tax=Paracoccus sp. p3-h83 TaxID=3342805 RepID=UPI0035B782B8
MIFDSARTSNRSPNVGITRVHARINPSQPPSRPSRKGQLDCPKGQTSTPKVKYHWNRHRVATAPKICFSLGHFSNKINGRIFDCRTGPALLVRKLCLRRASRPVALHTWTAAHYRCGENVSGGSVVSLFVRDEALKELAGRLAAISGLSETEAVRRALEGAIRQAKSRQTLSERCEPLQQRARRFGLMPNGFDDKPDQDEMSGGL